MKAKYDSKENCLQEQPDRKKSDMPVGPVHISVAYLYERKREEYNAHIASLRKISCAPEAVNVFKHGELYEYGKDYSVHMVCVNTGNFDNPICAMNDTCDHCAPFAVPLDPLKGEDDIWKEMMSIINKGIMNMQLDFEMIAELKKQFSITKKQ
jgi:hypothetical protein